MQDMTAHLEKLRKLVAEAYPRSRADKAKRELFEKLAQHFKVRASEIERAIAKAKSA